MPGKKHRIIGVDAGCLGVLDERLKVGVYRVAYNLLKELGKIDERNVYRLYSFYPIEKRVMNFLGERMKNLVLQPKTGWFRLRLPLELKYHPVDIFLGLSQALPYSLSHNILLVHDLAFEHYPEFYLDSYRKLSKNTRFSVRCANKIIAVSQSTKDDLVNFYEVPEDKINVYYEGVSEDFCHQGEKIRLDVPYFLFVGSLKKKKNIPRILKGFANFLKEARVDYKLVLIGGDLWFDCEIPKMIKELDLEKQILKMGFVEDKELVKFYRGAVAFISPSLYEGFGITHLEAMACGTPVIAGNVSSMPETVGKVGLLVDPKSEKEIKGAMLRIAVDKKLRQDLIKSGLNRAKRFTWRKLASKVAKLIEDS